MNGMKMMYRLPLEINPVRMGGAAKCWLSVAGLGLYNHTITGEIIMTLSACRADAHKIPRVLIINSSGRGVAGTIDTSYYKDAGERQGVEREYIVVRNDSGSSNP